MPMIGNVGEIKTASVQFRLSMYNVAGAFAVKAGQITIIRQLKIPSCKRLCGIYFVN
jgi:hypothetical protein